MKWGDKKTSEPFYTHHHGYKFTLRLDYTPRWFAGFDIYLCPMRGEYDSQLCWPVEVKVHIQLLNQAGDHDHMEKTTAHMIKTEQKGYSLLNVIPPHLRNAGNGIKYVMNDCLKFRINITVL